MNSFQISRKSKVLVLNMSEVAMSGVDELSLEALPPVKVST